MVAGSPAVFSLFRIEDIVGHLDGSFHFPFDVTVFPQYMLIILDNGRFIVSARMEAPFRFFLAAFQCFRLVAAIEIGVQFNKDRKEEFGYFAFRFVHF